MLTSKFLKGIVAEARPIIERQLDDAELITGLRDVFSAQGGDWGALKALIKSHIQDERDQTGDGKRIRRRRDRATNEIAYADMLGLGNMNEFNFSEEHDADGVFPDDEPQSAPSAAQGGDTHAEPVASQPIQPEMATQSTAARMDVPSLDPQVPEEHALTAGRVRAVRGKAHEQGDSPVGEMSGTIEASKQRAAESVAGTQAPPVDTKFNAKTLRPHCKQPFACGGQGKQHCWKCLKAAGLEAA